MVSGQTKYRGAMVAPYAAQADVLELLNLGANLLRYQIVDPSGNAGRMEPWEYTQWVVGHLHHLRNVIAPCLSTADKVVIDLHSPPGGYLIQPGNAATYAMYTVQPWHRDTFKNTWQMIAESLDLEPWVLAYDLLNEPAGTAHQVTTLYRNTIKELRAAGFAKPCIVSTPYGDPGRVKDLYIYSQPGVWYQVHMYKPMNVTHQGINGFPVGKAYPGPNTGLWRVTKDLRAFTDFLDAQHVVGFLGEFGISSMTDDTSRRNWARDVVTVLEEIGVQWCMHAWRESPVWQPTDSYLSFMIDAWNKNA